MKSYRIGAVAVALFMIFMGVMLILGKLGDREFAENELSGWVDTVATISDVVITREYGPVRGFNKKSNDVDAYEYELYYTYQIEFETLEGDKRSFSVNDSYEGSETHREIPESAYDWVYNLEGEHDIIYNSDTVDDMEGVREIVYNPVNAEWFIFGTSDGIQESAEDNEDIIVGAAIIPIAIIVIVICVVKTVKERKSAQTPEVTH